MREIIETVGRISPRPVPFREGPRRAGDPPVLVAGNRRAAEGLGWRPRRSLTDAVADAWAWMREHPDGYAER